MRQVCKISISGPVWAGLVWFGLVLPLSPLAIRHPPLKFWSPQVTFARCWAAAVWIGSAIFLSWLEFKLQLVPCSGPVRDHGSGIFLETLPLKTFFCKETVKFRGSRREMLN